MPKNLLIKEENTNKRKLYLSKKDTSKLILLRFAIRFPKFLPALRNAIPGITHREEELCVLILLEMPPQETAKRMNIMHKSVITTRHRLRQRIGISKSESLDKVINNIFEILT